ncbi:Chaperone protein DnaK [Symmachiella macrocystis]|uniref:Chaperone protein DnaK n=1 Tax=Symmachiella macrocystis TaxID=2527985 RepID=A0A5C6B1D4_9PLAN|nr:Hsp70 family protein [Symmachiella macrocystis]TWU05279.1 Chaperone protein DnaK [Symmachiella macrocystis]
MLVCEPVTKNANKAAWMSNTQQIAVGIDLGTTFSAVAYLDASRRPCMIVNSEGDRVTPSVVLFDESSVIVGKEAVKAAAMEPDRIADYVKRDIGSPHFSRPILGEQVPPEVIQSLILEKLKNDTEKTLGPIQDVVVTVPAFFNEPRRKATQDAGRLAGLNVLDVINEPTAAAIAYGYQQGFLDEAAAARKMERVLVYDLGGGTFDVTLMEIDGKNYNTVATAGDVYLGGLDWDRRLVDFIAEKYQEKYRGLDPRQNPSGMQKLLREAEDAKRTLTARDQATISFEHAGEGIRVTITREEFESLTADLVERTLFTMRKVLKDAGVGWEDVTRLLLVGGSSRMPMIRRAVEQASGLNSVHSASEDEAVAQGAAIYAGLLLAVRDGEAPSMQIKNVNSHSLGVLAQDPETRRPRNSVIIAQNTVLPVTKGKRFRTSKPAQKNIAVKVIEGGDSSGNNATPIGQCLIDNLPDGLPAGTTVEVIFQYAANGRLKVRARVPSIDREVAMTIKRDSGLTQATFHQWHERLSNTAGPLGFQNQTNSGPNGETS